MSFGEKLKNCRKNLSLSQKELGQKIGVAESTVSLYESNKRFPDADTLKKIATLLSVSIDYLLGNSPLNESESKSTSRGVRIPILGSVASGPPMDIEEIMDYEEIPKSLAATGEFFALKVKGSSMEPTLRDGDVVVVKKQSSVASGDIAVVLVNGHEATIKEVEVKENPAGITLIGHNVSVYTPHFYAREEIGTLPIRVIGKVVEMRRKL